MVEAKGIYYLKIHHLGGDEDVFFFLRGDAVGDEYLLKLLPLHGFFFYQALLQRVLNE